MNASSQNMPAALLTLHMKAEALRTRMHQAAAKHGLGDARVLRLSRALDKVVVEIMKQESGAG